ncbi:DNA adenine methylase [Anaerotruncus sp.]|uniref:DNA adenine methylase n=1 Tax=Anaerotruncus TaxID=244127 RepID=UPI0021736102|nr:DNA adenine methylase [Anaerotruncus sp.]
MARPFFPWVGSKEKLIPYIRRIMPEKLSQYVEPFGGSGAVLLSMKPRPGRLDIYNDFNVELVNLFCCVKEQSNALLRELRFFPLHSREEFEWYKSFLEHRAVFFENIEAELKVLEDRDCFTEEQAEALTPILRERAQLYDVYRAAAYFKRVWGSFSGTTNSFGIKPLKLKDALERLLEAAKRLEDAVIENKDAVKLILDRDRPDGLIYCDPPYYDAEQYYDAAFSAEDHVRLHDAIKECKGYVIVSYNDCEEIRRLYSDFYQLSFTRQNPMAQQAGAVYEELLMTNYDPRLFAGQVTLFDSPLEFGGLRLTHIPEKPLKII